MLLDRFTGPIDSKPMIVSVGFWVLQFLKNTPSCVPISTIFLESVTVLNAFRTSALCCAIDARRTSGTLLGAAAVCVLSFSAVVSGESIFDPDVDPPLESAGDDGVVFGAAVGLCP